MRLPLEPGVADTDVITLPVPSLKKLWFVVPETPPPPRIMWTVPRPVSMSSVAVETGLGVSVSVPLTTPRTARERS
ncbi:hypothetical protein ACRAWF_09865 [Streptomyces sp. L7]